MPHSQHLRRRGNIYYLHRRVPLDLVAKYGKSQVSYSLGTTDLKKARKKRDLEDLKLDAEFDQLRHVPSAKPGPVKSMSVPTIIRMVQDYVDRVDGLADRKSLVEPGLTEGEAFDVKQDLEIGRSVLKNQEDPNGLQWLHSEGQKILGHSLADLDTPSLLPFLEVVRRGLLELQERKLLRLDGDFSRPFLDPLFNPQNRQRLTFGEIADQHLAAVMEEARANDTSQRWVDQQQANIGLLKEIVGADTSLPDLNFDACMRLRAALAAIPANWKKTYPDLDLASAMRLASERGLSTMAAKTQDQYLFTFRKIMGLALKKQLIMVNPADGLKPLRREQLNPKDRRLPLTPEQLQGFFNGTFYRLCAQSQPDAPFLADREGWRFWMPLMTLFMSLRPNEICPLQVSDIKQTEGKTWFIHVTTFEDDDEGDGTVKRVKTESSRRKVPIHPDLLAIGFLAYVERRRSDGAAARLFPTLKPDKYGYLSKYPLRRFNEKFFPDEIRLDERQSYYSLRHNFRDAMRRAEAPPEALKALGGWSQRKVVLLGQGPVPGLKLVLSSPQRCSDPFKP
jgi:integrase